VDQDTVFEGSKVLKERILRNLQADAEAAAARALEAQNSAPRPRRVQFEDDNKPSSYIDESLLPVYNEDVEYNDEYDDTYDEVGVGMTEPDNVLYKPLNFKARDLRANDNGMDEDESDQEPSKRNDNFVEDPAIVRARFEAKRMQKSQNNPGRYVPPQYRQQGVGVGDVVGKAKGHGQQKEVVLNRRMKDQAGSHNRRKRSDFKRKEF
jgi:hypothetical protein